MKLQNWNTNAVDFVMAVEPLSSEQLQNLLQNISSKESLLLIDCRSFLEYNSGHISAAHNVHCPPIVKRRAGGSLSLQNILRDAECRSRLLSGQYSNIVIYDDRSVDLQCLSSDSILLLVLKGLSENCIGSHIQYLEGGFETFHAIFPESCTSHISSESESTASPQIHVTQSVTLVSASPVDTQEMVTSPVLPHMQGDTIKYRPSQDQGDPEAILPWLYLGSAYHATQENRLQTLGINALLSLSRFDNHTPSGSFVNHCIGVDDDCMSDIRCWFPEAIDFIESVRKNGGKVLVHCHAGISRSATVCIAYIMWLRHWTMECAYQFLKSKRSLIAPNLNFMRQLVEFENELEENGRGHASTSSTSSSSSYASAVSCLECDAMALPERPCKACASLTSELGAACATSPSHGSLCHHGSDASLDQSRDIFSSPCQFRHHHHLHHHHHSRADASKTNTFSFDFSSVNTTNSAPPKSASAALLSALPKTTDSARPTSAHPALFTLPLTTCAQQVFSFDSPICSPPIHPQHTNSPTLCHSPLLSPG